MDGKRPDACRDGGAVDDRQPLFRVEDGGLQSGAPEGIAARRGAPVDLGLSLTNQDETQVREGGKVAAGAEGASGWHQGMHASIQHVQKELDEDSPDP